MHATSPGDLTLCRPLLPLDGMLLNVIHVDCSTNPTKLPVPVHSESIIRPNLDMKVVNECPKFNVCWR